MNIFFQLAITVWVYMTVWFVIALLKKRNDVADVAWGLGFPLMAWVTYALAPHAMAGTRVALLVNVLVTIWGLRLALHIYRRNHGKPEDYRYAQWRREWGKWFVLRSYAQVYLLQGALLYCIALPVLINNVHATYSFGILHYVGLALWVIGFLFESTADRQLRAFVRDENNKGKIMRSGLWKYSRHPNYFGEVTQWWGIGLLTLWTAGGWSIVGPLTITCLILFVSGVPLLEKKMAQKPEFAEYKKRTSVLVPWWPRRA